MDKLLHQLKSYSSFSISCGNTDEVVQLHNTKRPNTTKTELENIIDNFDFSNEIPNNLDTNKTNDDNAIHWFFKDILKESYKVNFPVSTFIGCEFVNFEDDGIYICIITKNKLFYKKIYNNDVFPEAEPPSIEVLSRTQNPSNIDYLDDRASLSTINDIWCNLKQPMDPNLISSYMSIYDTDFNKNIIIDDSSKDYDFDFMEKVPSFQIRQYVAFDNFICILRDMRDSFEDLDPSLFLITDPFGDYHPVQMNTDQHDYVIPMWIDGFVNCVKNEFYLTFLNSESKTTETYHLSKKIFSDGEDTQWVLDPLLKMPLSNNLSSYLKRASVLQTPLNNSDITGLLSTNSIIVNNFGKTLLIYYYTIKVENNCILKTFAHEVEDDGIVTFLSSSVHTFCKQILSVDFQYDIKGFSLTFADSTMGYSLFFLNNNKLEIKNVVFNTFKSLKKVESCFFTMKLLKLFKCANLQLNSGYLGIFPILIASILDKDEKMTPIDGLFKLLSQKDCKHVNREENKELYDIIKLSLLNTEDTHKLFETLFSILFWYHEELVLDTSSSYFREKIGIKLKDSYARCDSTSSCDWRLMYLISLYAEKTNTLRNLNNISSANLIKVVNGTTSDLRLSDKSKDFPKKSLMNICFLLSSLLIKNKRTGLLNLDIGRYYSKKEPLLILDFFEEVSNLPIWFNSITFSRIFKIMNAFMDVASNLLNNNTDEAKRFSVTMSLDDYFPLSFVQLFQSFSITNEKMLHEIGSLNDFDSKKFFLRNDIEKTIKGLKGISEDCASESFLNSTRVNESKILSCARTLAYMHPILNNSLFNNKIAYSDREKVKTIEFLRHISKPIGWASLFYNSDNSSILNSLNSIDIHTINLEIMCGFDEYQTIPCKEKDAEKLISLQFSHMAKFSAGIARGLSLEKGMHAINSLSISKYRPAKLTPEYGGFMYGLGLNGYLNSWDSTSIYYTVVSKFIPMNRGFFLGLGCSNVGSPKDVITKIMLIHLQKALPRKNLDLNHHFTLQISALLGLGLLYSGKQHRPMAELLLPLAFSKITINEERTQKISFNISAGIAVGLTMLYDVGRITDESYNNDVDVFNCDILTLADKKSPLCHLAVVICLLLVNLKSRKEHVVKVLAMFMDKNGSSVIDLESSFYLRFVKNMVMWNSNTEGLISAFNNLQEKYSKPDSLTFENVMLYYEFAADVLSFSIQNVGMCNVIVKKLVLRMLEDLATLSLGINNNLDSVDMSYTMKICMKHFLTIRRILLEALALNFCSSGDEDIIELCNFYLSSEDDVETEFHNENYPAGADLGESIFDPEVQYELCQNVGNGFKKRNIRPLYYDSERNYVDFDFMMPKIGRHDVGKDSMPSATMASRQVLSNSDELYEEIEEPAEEASRSSIDQHDGHEESANQESEPEESDEERYFVDNYSDDENVGDKDSIKNKRDFTEKTSYFSDIYADSLSASFSLGLLNLSTKRKIIDVSGDQKNLAFLSLSMLPIVNSFPFELQDVKYFYFMAVSDKNMLCVLNAENDESLDDQGVELKVEYSDGQEFIKEAPFCIPRLHDVTRLSVVDKTYYPISITGEALLEKQSKNDCIKLYVKKISSAKDRSYFKATASTKKEDVNSLQDEVNYEFKKKLSEAKDIDEDPEVNLFVMSDINPDFSIDLWDAKNFG